MGVISRHFLRLTSPEMRNALKELQARTGTGGGERIEDIRACRRQSRTYLQTAEQVMFLIFRRIDRIEVTDAGLHEYLSIEV